VAVLAGQHDRELAGQQGGKSFEIFALGAVHPGVFLVCSGGRRGVVACSGHPPFDSVPIDQ
jgi:hypothetical protein